MRTVLLLMLAWGLCPCQAWTQTMILAWEYDGPPPDAFLLSLVDSRGQALNLTVAPSAPGACASLPGSTPATFCAAWPNCLTPGVWNFLAAAEQGGEHSPSSDPMTCTVKAGSLCTCTTSAALLPSTTPATPSTAPAPPAPTSQVPPAPTLADVQALLNAVPPTQPGQALSSPDLLPQALAVSAPPLHLPQGGS